MRDDREAATAPVLVTGATGNVGREVVRALRARGRPVRAGVRRMADGDQLHGTGAEIVPFDFQDPDTFKAAAAGASAVFLLRPPAISKVRPTLNAFVDVAVDQGVGHVVFLSVIGADKNSIVPRSRSSTCGTSPSWPRRPSTTPNITAKATPSQVPTR